MENPIRQTELLVRKINPEIELPVYRHEDDAGFDLVCSENCIVAGNSCLRVPTGLAFAIPQGFELQLRMRSSMAEKTPLIMPNAPATIDAGYRGEVFILLRNLSGRDWPLEKNERIVQAILAPVWKARLKEVNLLPESDRGSGGFGSTGRF